MLRNLVGRTLSLGLIVALFLVFVSLISCSKETCEEHPNEDCICTKEYMPVCGCNKKTYGNACEATCAGITEFTAGPCIP